MTAPALPAAPGLQAACAYAALLDGLEAGLLAPADADALRAAADARLFGEADVEQRMQTVYGILYRACAEAGADLPGLRRLRNQLFSIPRGAARG